MRAAETRPLTICYVVGFALAGGVSLAAEGDPARLALRSEVTLDTPTVRLADVLVFQQADLQLVERIADQPAFGRERTSGGELTLTHEQIARRLDELGVNLGTVLLGGAAQCKVKLPATAADAGRAGALSLAADELREPAAPVLRELAREAGARTLADVVRAQIDHELAKLGGRGDVKFEFGGQALLQLTTPPFEFAVSATGAEKLGLREFQVTIRRDGQHQRKAKVFAQVQLVRPVVVAKRPLNPGNLVGSADVAVETRVLDQTNGLAAAGLGEVVGQQIKKFVPPGAVVAPDALQPGDLVTRSRPVTVISASGSVQVRLTGIALDSGGIGDTVRVRMGENRGRTVLHGTVAGLATVKLLEGRP